MIKAPRIGDVVLVSALTDPDLFGRVTSIVGYQGHGDEDEWVVLVKVRGEPCGDEVVASAAIDGGFEVHVQERSNRFGLMDAVQWDVVDPQRARSFSRDEIARRQRDDLTTVMRWLLGEAGEFPTKPVSTDKYHRNYWWRHELRDRVAAILGPSFAVRGASPNEASE